jgi:hypothetical protein
MRDDFGLRQARDRDLETKSGWYFMQTRGGWERHGPYTGVSAGRILQRFQEQGGEPRVGDRIYIDGELFELADSGPPRLVARGAGAEDEMQRMQAEGFRYR